MPGSVSRWRGRRVVPPAQFDDHLGAVDVGQADVEDDRVRRVAGGEGQRLPAGARGQHLVLAGPQVDPQRADQFGLVLDDENAATVGDALRGWALRPRNLGLRVLRRDVRVEPGTDAVTASAGISETSPHHDRLPGIQAKPSPEATSRSPGKGGDQPGPRPPRRPPQPAAGRAPGSGRGGGAVLLALRALPDLQREALVLRYYADLADAQVASAMGIGARSVHVHISRGVAALQAALDGRGPSLPPGQLR